MLVLSNMVRAKVVGQTTGQTGPTIPPNLPEAYHTTDRPATLVTSHDKFDTILEAIAARHEALGKQHQHSGLGSGSPECRPMKSDRPGDRS